MLTCSRTYTVDGFFLDDNSSEAIYLDDIIFQDLDPSQKEELELQQYYGYVLGHCLHCFLADLIQQLPTNCCWRLLPHRDRCLSEIHDAQRLAELCSRLFNKKSER